MRLDGGIGSGAVESEKLDAIVLLGFAGFARRADDLGVGEAGDEMAGAVAEAEDEKPQGPGSLLATASEATPGTIA